MVTPCIEQFEELGFIYDAALEASVFELLEFDAMISCHCFNEWPLKRRETRMGRD